MYDEAAVVSGSGERHERLIATKGPGYLFVYSYAGRPFTMRPAHPGILARRALF